MIRFTAYGKSETAGSKKAFALRRRDGSIVTREGGAPVVSVTDDNPKSKGWKDTVAWAAREALPAGAYTLLRGPLRVEFTFFRTRPKGHFKKDGSLSRDGFASRYPTPKPDVLKLARAAEDALTGVIWNDDAQIVTEVLLKRWGDPPRMEAVIAWDNLEVGHEGTDASRATDAVGPGNAEGVYPEGAAQEQGVGGQGHRGDQADLLR